jgi:two-component system cell cycle sensor histidine kinase/response regulator CckA
VGAGGKGDQAALTREGTVIGTEVERLQEALAAARAELAELRDLVTALRDNERQLATVAEHAPDFILRLDRHGTITYMNRPAPGYTLADMIGSDVRRWMMPEAHPAFERTLHEVFVAGQASSYESRGSVTGQHYVHRVSPVVVRGEVESAILITHDITEIKRAYLQLAEAEARFLAMTEASFEGLTISVANRVVVANQAFAQMLGMTVTEVIGVSPADVTTPESAEVIVQRMRAGSTEPYEVVAVRKDGTTFPCEILGRNITYRGQPARLSGFRDLTERRQQEAEQERREDRVRHAQKLETLGVLTGGVAHDFNNLLATILTHVEVALAGIANAQRVRDGLQRIGIAARRASELTSQLLTYSGRAERRTEAVDINGFIKDTAELTRVSISKKASLVISLAEDLPAIEADVGQLQQVLVNLMTNASEALDHNAGVITIVTGIQQADASYLQDCYADQRVAPGLFVFMEVADDGSGMDSETQRRIFDPFFTTKVAGRGLGLASVLGIARSHHAAIRLWSSLGGGTRFRVLFPARPKNAPAPRPQTARAVAANTPARGTILLADDEPQLARNLRELLELIGYDVLLAKDGIEALELFDVHHDAIVCALIDVTMPRKDGLEVLSEIRKRSQQMPVVLMSGHSEAELGHVLRDGSPTGFLRKPFDMDELSAALGGARN